MAPEMLNYLDDDNDSDEYTNAIDLWAVGCIVYRLLTGKIPFPPGRLLMKYCSDKSLFPLDPLFDYGIKSEGAKFIRELLAPYPEDRPSASEALKHNWIAASKSHTLLPYYWLKLSKVLMAEHRLLFLIMAKILHKTWSLQCL